MTQDELIRRLAKDADLFLYQARNVLKSLPEIIEEVVAEGDSVRLQGFGTFKAQEFASKIGRNPGTGEEVPIPARRGLVFKPTKRLKDLENGTVKPDYLNEICAGDRCFIKAKGQTEEILEVETTLHER